jgi:hypothetical protein
VKNKISLVILLILGFTFLVIFPFNALHAAKFQSGVTIVAPSASNPQPAGTCTDSNNDGVNDVTGQPCSSPDAAAGTCGLQIVSGVPINYGQLTPGQTSAEKQVVIKNEGTSQTPAKLMIKGDNWRSDPGLTAVLNPWVQIPNWTHVSIAPIDFNNKKPLLSAGMELGQISGGQSIPIYFQFLAWEVTPTSNMGSFHQDVTIDLIC